MVSGRVEALIKKMVEHKENPDRVEFQREIDHFTENELKELALWLVDHSGLVRPSGSGNWR
jgi:hypothetical protein